MSKDIWIAEFDRLLGELEEAGLSEAEAYEAAGKLTDERYRDRLADMIDQARMEAKEKKYGV